MRRACDFGTRYVLPVFSDLGGQRETGDFAKVRFSLIVRNSRLTI
jgi:hypothetical protein